MYIYLSIYLSIYIYIYICANGETCFNGVTLGAAAASDGSESTRLM